MYVYSSVCMHMYVCDVYVYFCMLCVHLPVCLCVYVYECVYVFVHVVYVCVC